MEEWVELEAAGGRRPDALDPVQQKAADRGRQQREALA